MAGAPVRSGGLERDPNLLPMIDVLLVLLIIFLLNVRYVLDVQVPPPGAAQPSPSPTQIVLELLKDGSFVINGQPVPDAQLETTLQEIYRPRAVKLLFVKPSPELKYQDVVAAMGRSKGAGVEVVALMPASP